MTSLADSGPGTLRDAIHQYNGTGRYVVFDIGGTITLESNVVLRGAYVTIDGSTAPPPGITIRKASPLAGVFTICGTHDVIVSHLRFHGLWEAGGEHMEGAATISIDGDSGPDHVARAIVLDHVTARNATDGGPDIWGEVQDLTLSWCFFLYNWHPTTVSHYPGPYQTRNRISMHHNVYAKNGERCPQLRADVRNFDFVNNILYDWAYFGENSGTAMRIKNNPGEPHVNANVINNIFLPRSGREAFALIYGINPGPDSADGGPEDVLPQGTLYTDSLMGDLFVYGNLLPPENEDHYSTVPEPLFVPEHARVQTWNAEELPEMLPCVGTHYRTPDEEAILAELYTALTGAPPDDMGFAENCRPRPAGNADGDDALPHDAQSMDPERSR